MGLLKGGERPALGLQPLGMSLGPGAFRRREPATMPQQKLGETVPRAQAIDADGLTAP
jgi:hypothetical protein